MSPPPAAQPGAFAPGKMIEAGNRLAALIRRVTSVSISQATIGSGRHEAVTS